MEHLKTFVSLSLLLRPPPATATEATFLWNFRGGGGGVDRNPGEANHVVASTLPNARHARSLN